MTRMACCVYRLLSMTCCDSLFGTDENAKHGCIVSNDEFNPTPTRVRSIPYFSLQAKANRDVSLNVASKESVRIPCNTFALEGVRRCFASPSSSSSTQFSLVLADTKTRERTCVQVARDENDFHRTYYKEETSICRQTFCPILTASVLFVSWLVRVWFRFSLSSGFLSYRNVSSYHLCVNG